ncbi:serine/threonine-protein kinase [Streptococcus agalactiae]|uniref:serine/threonine-protein kinase n=1 Tax=Streptococcus agalactiae TaxID=1311 RepID=UPI000D9159FA|nr:serine/threonine-protein kinase [Streptococcus agalactiae]SQA16970.1 serine/threonine-protein kinase [Streptococcus agalactiae]
MAAIESGAALGASYRLVRRLGAGAAGEVWLAESLRGPETFAAKILKAEHAHDPTIVERFVRERSVLLGLRHSNVVAVRDLVVEGETLAIVMDYVPGGSLRDILDARGTLRPAEVLRAISQVFAGLAAAHAKQITHRDVKPDNVLLASGEILDGVQIADFGIAAVLDERNRTTTGLVGTPQYMAPELISQGQVTLRWTCTQPASCSTSCSVAAPRSPAVALISRLHTATSRCSRRDWNSPIHSRPGWTGCLRKTRVSARLPLKRQRKPSNSPRNSLIFPRLILRSHRRSLRMWIVHRPCCAATPLRESAHRRPISHPRRAAPGTR